MKPASNDSNRLPKKRVGVRIAVALALSSAAIGSQAAGLGRLNVLSSIGQPLRAEIELTAVGRDEAGPLNARLASPDAFGQANIDYGAALTGLRFSIQRRTNGQPYVLMTSNALVNEPFLDVLVELSWGSGRLVREYTLLLDPPETRVGQRLIEPGTTIIQAQSAPAVIRAPSSRPPAPAAGNGSIGGETRASAPFVAPPPASPIGAPGRGSASGTPGGEYLVRNGDTALSIARDNKPEGVALEQMLAALYRDNPQAFAGNVNRLLAGATVKLPDTAAAQGLDASEARRIVAQSNNFGSYRERIARNAAQAPTTRAAGQQASGRLSTQVEDRAAPAADAGDRLQLSRPDATKSAAGTAGAAGTRGGAGGPTADELAAKDRELQETRTRLALLEKNVADLTRLLELKNQSLASAPGTTAAGAATSSTVAGGTPAGAAPPTTPTPNSASTTPPAPAAATAISPPAAAPTPTPAPAAATPPPRAPAATTVTEESWLDSVKDNSLLMAALIAAVTALVAYVIYTARRRRKLARFEDSIFVDNSVLHANSVFGTTGGQSVDTANSGFHSNFVPVAGNLPEQNEVDPVAEADVYIAYGRDAQAEEILKEALRSDGARPAVRLKLLEIYAKRGDAKTFETMASELYATTGGQGDDWSQAAAMGATLDPRNPLYADAAPAAAAGAATGAFSRAPAPSPRDLSSIDTGLGTSVLGAGISSFGISSLNMGNSPAAGEQVAPSSANNDHTRTDPLPRADAPPATSAPSMDLDFDLGFANQGAAPLSAGAPAPTPSPAPAAPTTGNGLDFDVGQSAKPLIDPFTASAFGGGDASARTAVNLPAFRARAEQESPPAAPPARHDGGGFSASDIFGSSITADTLPMYGETPPEPTPPQARTQDFRNVVGSNQFDRTEPLDAFGDINLDLDQGGYESTDVAPENHARTDIWQAMATKLDLALAYSDIGDKDGARELLEEVVRNGDPTQANRARQLIGELG